MVSTAVTVSISINRVDEFILTSKMLSATEQHHIQSSHNCLQSFVDTKSSHNDFEMKITFWVDSCSVIQHKKTKGAQLDADERT